jgi:hypothetical protein
VPPYDRSHIISLNILIVTQIIVVSNVDVDALFKFNIPAEDVQGPLDAPAECRKT